MREGGEPVTKVELVSKVAENTQMTKKDVGACIDALFSVIQETLTAGEKVQLTGFGTFEVRERAARKGRNPQTGAEIDIAARRMPVFRAGKLLKDSVSK
ncbi:MAG: HU family DNA-binding protein [Firmicutes bacterium]|nr:HU family DNA-binding protein [Bacillota bacterium]